MTDIPYIRTLEGFAYLAVVNLLKRERIMRRTYRIREEARQDVFDYIEMFYQPKRRHARNGVLSPAEFERQQILRREGVSESRGYSN